MLWLDGMSRLFSSKIYYILSQTENKHFIFTIHTLNLGNLVSIPTLLYSDTSLSRHFFTPTILFGYCHTSIFFFTEKKSKNIQKMILIKTETFVFYFSWSQKRNLLSHAQDRSFTCLLFRLHLVQLVFGKK